MYVCMYVCMCVGVCVCMNVYVCVCMYVRMYECTRLKSILLHSEDDKKLQFIDVNERM
jgi:hypothetical protein